MSHQAGEEWGQPGVGFRARVSGGESPHEQWQVQWASTECWSMTRVAGGGRFTPAHQARAQVIRRSHT